MQSPRPRSLGLLRGEVVKQAENNGTAMPTLPRLRPKQLSRRCSTPSPFHRSFRCIGSDYASPQAMQKTRPGLLLITVLAINVAVCYGQTGGSIFEYRSSLFRHSALNAIHAKQTAKNFVLYALDIAKHWWALMHMICRCHILGLQVTTTFARILT